MSQINFTLNYDEVVALFLKEKNEAFAYLMEKILNAFLLAESEEQIGAGKYERNEKRSDYRNGTRGRPLVTRIGKLILKIPRHRNVPFSTILFDQYQRNEAALITTMMEMVVQGVSTRKVTNVVEELCGTSFSKSTVSELCKALDENITAFQTRTLEDPYPFLIVDAKYFKVRENHRIVSKAFMVAMGITEDGRREIVGFGTYDNESEATWKEFFISLKERGLNPDMVTSDAHQGLLAALKEVYPEVPWQRCQVHFLKNILKETPKNDQEGLRTELREMFTAKTIEEARQRRDEIIYDYEGVAPKAMEKLELGFEDAMTVMLLPENMRTPLRTTNYVERENGELGRRSDVIRIFPNENSLTRLMGAAVLIDRHDIMSTRNALFTKNKCTQAIKEIKPKLIKIAYEQVNLLKAS